jgi:ketopantoate hydroxymethyltransferase
MAVTTQQLTQWKQQGRAIVALTAWDYAIAQLLDLAGVDLILVGDSLAVVLGYETTLPITLDEPLTFNEPVIDCVVAIEPVVISPVLLKFVANDELPCN